MFQAGLSFELMDRLFGCDKLDQATKEVFNKEVMAEAEKQSQ